MAIPGACDLAPRGQSKYTHLSDGCLDLVIIQTSNRDDFLKFLRRHGKAKNQVLLVLKDYVIIIVMKQLYFIRCDRIIFKCYKIFILLTSKNTGF